MFATTLSLLYLFCAVSAAAVGSSSSSSGGDAVDDGTGPVVAYATPREAHAVHEQQVVSLYAKAAASGIDLGKAPAWEPVEALGLVPIVPGPGLPSLESLSLTWADLIKSTDHATLPTIDREERALMTSKNELEERQLLTPPYCHLADDLLTRDYAYACFWYLNGLGSTACVVPPSGSWIRFCSSAGVPKVSWYGSSRNSFSQSSTCAAVSAGGDWVMNNCYRTAWPPGQYGGTSTSTANGNLLVRVTKDFGP